MTTPLFTRLNIHPVDKSSAWLTLPRTHTTPGTMTRKLKNYWTRVSEWTLQPSGVDTDSSESPAPRRARPPRAPPLRLRPRTPRAGPAAAPLRRPGARAASRRARARYPGEQRIQMGNLHPRATVETTCPVRDRLARAPPRAAAADGDRPPPQATAAVASDPSPPRGAPASPRRPDATRARESGQTLEPYRATSTVRELGITCSARVKIASWRNQRSCAFKLGRLFPCRARWVFGRNIPPPFRRRARRSGREARRP